MAKNNNIGDFCKAIADSIRTRKGTSDTINAQDFCDEIESIPTGGIADSTKELANVVSGTTPTTTIELDNAIAEGATDSASKQTIAERTTASGATIKDTIAYIDTLKGNTIKYNQWTKAFSIGWVVRNASVTSVSYNNGVATLTSLATSADVYKFGLFHASTLDNVPTGHKLLGMVYVKSSITGEFAFQVSGTLMTRFTPSASGQMLYGIVTKNSDGRVQVANTYALTLSEGDTMEISQPMVFDLTQMFGSGNEPSSADEFAKAMGYESAESMPYLPYNEGSLVSFVAESIQSKDTEGATLDTLAVNPYELKDTDGNSIFPNGLLSAGTAHDEWNVAEGKAIKRIGMVDLGTLTWSRGEIYTSGIYDFHVIIDDVNPPSSTSVTPNIVTPSYSTHKATEYVKITTGVCTMGGTKRLCIKDTSYTDVATFKTAISGVMLYYELATPIEYTIDKQKAYYKVSANGTEALVSTEQTAPMVADIAYRYDLTEASATSLGTDLTDETAE